MTTTSNGTNLQVQGRIVWTVGNLFEGKKKLDYNTKQVMFDNLGNEIVEYGFGLAIPKTDPATGQHTEMFKQVWNALHQEANTIYPNGQLPPNFAFKYKDGDGIDQNGKPFADREGYAGHIVLSLTTRIPIKYYIWSQGQNIVVNNGIKSGDYVNVQLNIKAHGKVGNGVPGLYLNPSAVQLIQAGKEIITAPSGDNLFGAQAPAAYAGQVIADTAPAMPQMTPATPQMGGAPAMPQMTPATPQMGGAPAMPQMTPATPQMGGAPAMPQMTPATPQGHSMPSQEQSVTPHYGVLPQQHQPNNVAGGQPVGNGVPPVATATGMMPSTPTTMNGTSAQAAYPSNGMTPPMPQ